MPILNNATDIRLGSTAVQAVYLGSNPIWQRVSYPDIPWLNTRAFTLYSGRNVTVNFRCSSPIDISVSSYIQDRFSHISPSYTRYESGAYEGSFGIEADNFPSNGPQYGLIKVKNTLTNDVTYIKVSVASTMSDARKVRIITGGGFNANEISMYFSFRGYTFDANGHLCVLFHNDDSPGNFAIIPQGQTDFANGVYMFAKTDDIETATPLFTGVSLSQDWTTTDIPLAIGGTWGAREFYGCTNVGFGNNAGYAFGGTAQGDYAAAAFSDNLTSGCEHLGITTDKPLASNGDYFSFTDSTSVSGMTLEYIE